MILARSDKCSFGNLSVQVTVSLQETLQQTRLVQPTDLKSAVVRPERHPIDTINLSAEMISFDESSLMTDENKMVVQCQPNND